MNKLIVLFFFIPTLSWGLTFKDGKQIDGDTLNSFENSNIPQIDGQYILEWETLISQKIKESVPSRVQAGL